MRDSLVYPPSAKENGIYGIVYVLWRYDEDGKITDLKIAKGIQEDLDTEALRLVKLMEQVDIELERDSEGRVLPHQHSVPVRFRLF